METEETAHWPEDAANSAWVAHTSWWDALLASDVVALDRLLADDLTFHSPGGTAETKAAFVENLASGRLSYDSVDGDTALARLHGQTAIITGQVDIQFRWEGQPMLEHLYYTAVYGWTSPYWRMLAWQSTPRADEQG
jgi:ketosteroid isomerase-like protein